MRLLLRVLLALVIVLGTTRAAFAQAPPRLRGVPDEDGSSSSSSSVEATTAAVTRGA